jgi:quinolinate synthase
MQDQNSDIVDKISRLRRERRAVILAHNYQRDEIQDIADFVGDSLELSQQAACTQAPLIVFCGVHFMAETASILAPDKKVLLPDPHAGCPMANMITAENLLVKKAKLPGVPVVCYVNSSAAVKAESDICCTSSNAFKVIESLGATEILFVPDQYLGSNVAAHTKRNIHLWPGYCPTHARILPDDIQRLKNTYPRAKVVVHPECRPSVVALADAALSTSGIIRFARKTEASEIIVGTEVGILHRLRQENPGKIFYPASEKAICPNMKRITLEKILWCLEEMVSEVKVPEKIRLRAKSAVDRMLALS